VTDLLEVEGVDKFNVSWAQLQATVSEELERAAG
jgi:hypothetical protein